MAQRSYVRSVAVTPRRSIWRRVIDHLNDRAFPYACVMVASFLLTWAAHGQVLTDSAARAIGCSTRSDLSPALDSVALDSAGIRVIMQRSSPGQDSTGLTRWCPTGVVWLTRPGADLLLLDGRPFAAGPDGRYIPAVLLRYPSWDVNVWDGAQTDSVNTGFASWRAALAQWRGPPAAPVARLRLVIVARQGASNSVQMSELALLDSAGTPLALTASVLSNPGGASPDSESVANLTDGSMTTKWLDFNFTANPLATPGRSVLQVSAPPAGVAGYRWRAANDEPGRDPATILVDASPDDGATWTRVDSATFKPPSTRFGLTTRLFSTTAPPVVVVVPPPVFPLRCDGVPPGFAIGSASGGAIGSRTEVTTVLRAGRCLGAVVLASASRYQALHRDCTTGVWVPLPGAADPSRQAALDHVVRAACPALLK